jgi:PAS domain S-box-containing protein
VSSRPSRGTARLAAILDALPDALLLVNANGTVVNANSIALEAFESPGSALVGRGLLDLLPSFDPRRIPGSMRRPADDAGRTKPTRMIARRTDGSEFPVEVTSANLDDARTPFAETYSYTGDELLMLVVRDLTGTLDTEAELARQQRQTEMILRAASEGVIGVDTDGKVVLINPAAAQILGYRASDLGGQELHPLIHHSRRDGSPLPWEETPLADTLRSGLKHRARGQVLWRKDGRMVPVDLITAPVREGDQLVGAVMTFSDRSQYDALAGRYSQLQAVLGKSLLRPLGELRAELSGLASDPAGTLWPEANRILHHLTAGYGRITRLIDNVLSFQQLDRGEEKLELETTSLDKVAEAGVEGAGELIGPGQAQFAVHAPPIEATVDPARMAQALAHLIADVAGADAAGNMPVPGNSDSTIVVAAAQRGDVVRIEVRGPHTGGDPVHLPIARGIVERHGGVLQTHQMPGQSGSRSYVLEVPHTPGAGKSGAKAKEPVRESETTVMPVPTAPVRGTRTERAQDEPQSQGAGEARGQGRTPARNPDPDQGQHEQGQGGLVGASTTNPGLSGPVPTSAGQPPRLRQAGDDSHGGGPAPAQGAALALPAGLSSTVPGQPPASVPAPGAGDTPTGRRRALRRPDPEQAEGTGGGETAATGRRARRPHPEEQPPVPQPPVPQQSQESHQEQGRQHPEQQPRQHQWPDASGSAGSGQQQRSAIVDPRRLPDRSQADDTAAALAIEAVLNAAKANAAQPGQVQAPPAQPMPGIPEQTPRQSASQIPHARQPEPPQQPEPPRSALPQASPSQTTGQPQEEPQPDPNSQSQSISVRTLGQGIAFAQAQMASPAPAPPHGQPQEQTQPQAQTKPQRQAGLQPQSEQPPSEQSHVQPPAGPGRRRRLTPPGEGEARPHPVPDAEQAQPAQPAEPPHAQPKQPVQPPRTTAPRTQSAQTQPAQAPAAGAQSAQPTRPQADPADPDTAPLRPIRPGRAYAIGAPAEGAAEGPEPLDGPNGAVDVTPDGPIESRRLLVWPEPDVSTWQALADCGYRPVIVRSREEVDAQVAEPPAALFIDPLTGPITRTALQSLRHAAARAEVPVLVTAGLGQATREAAYGADPAVLLKALAPRDSEQHPPRVLLVEGHLPIAQAFTATLERREMQVAHAMSEADAMTLAAQVHPNLVVMDLMLVRRRRHGIVDWLRANGRLNQTPLVVYTAVDIDPAELPRLASGETVLFLAERSTSTDVQSRIVDLLTKLGS